MKIVAQAEGGMTEKGDKYDLVSASSLQAHVDETPRRRKQRAVPPPCTLRLELLDTEGQLISPAFFGCSCALDGLEDKDELVRTFQRCRADHLQFSPPSVLIKWDVQESECHNMLKELPALSEVTSKFAVLKEPMGSRGEGIYFVQSVEEMYRIIKEHRDRALHEGDDFLDSVMAHKGRIPSWGEYMYNAVLWTSVTGYSRTLESIPFVDSHPYPCSSQQCSPPSRNFSSSSDTGTSQVSHTHVRRSD